MMDKYSGSQNRVRTRSSPNVTDRNQDRIGLYDNYANTRDKSLTAPRQSSVRHHATRMSRNMLKASSHRQHSKSSKSMSGQHLFDLCKTLA
jgi:hypothetical protein